MSTENELSPEQKFNQILGEGAQRITELEKLRDNPPRTGPAPKLTPNGVDQGRHGVDVEAHRNYYNDLIGKEKATITRQTDEVAKGMPKHVQKGMQDKTLTTLYPENKGDLNQVSHREKAVDNSQERANDLRAAFAHSRTPNDGGKAQPVQGAEPPTSNSATTRFNQLISNNKQTPANKELQPTKADNSKAGKTAEPGELDVTSTRFSRSLTGDQGKADTTKTADKTDSPNKATSTSTRFSQLLTQSNDKAASSKPGKTIGSMSGKFTQLPDKD